MGKLAIIPVLTVLVGKIADKHSGGQGCRLPGSRSGQRIVGRNAYPCGERQHWMDHSMPPLVCPHSCVELVTSSLPNCSSRLKLQRL